MNAKPSAEVLHGFQQLRLDQRQLSAKVLELESDLTEHKSVT